MSNVDQKVSTDSYKGVRDFYPEDLRRRRYIEAKMADTVEQFGYEEIDASILEPAELYDAKSGEELAQEQSYRFEDRGGRDIMLRPEMTPTVSRMIAARAKSLPFPVRWYSIPNVFRYEQPQHGRLREHWQLNVDLFGVKNIIADLEIITIAHRLLSNFGAKEDDFIIKISSRELFTQLCQDILEIDKETRSDLARLIDKKSKLDKEIFVQALHDLVSEETADTLLTYLSIGELSALNDKFPMLAKPINQVEKVKERLADRDIGNVVFEPALIRGIAYYTGIVFEVFDTHPQNNRSLFGGGRYDNLMEVFDAEPVPAVGFGAGDVTLADFLDAHELWPDLEADIDIDICLVDRKSHAEFAYQVARQLQTSNLHVRVNISGTAVGTQLKHADQSGVKYVIVIGDDEVKSESVTVKELDSGEQTTVETSKLLKFFATKATTQ